MYPESLKLFIPPDFELSKYRAAVEFDLLDWARNLNNKHLLIQQVESEFPPEGIEERVANSISLGLVSEGFPTEQELIDLAMSEWSELLAIVREIRAFELTDKLNHHSQIEQSEDQLAIDINMTDEHDIAWLSVDMSCADKEIVNAFSGWLKRKRELERDKKALAKRRTYKLKQFSSASMRKWHDNRILPYLDLIAWNKLQKNRLTSKIIGDILFPEDSDLRDSTAIVNDTIKPLITELASKETLDRMLKVLTDKYRKKMS